MRRVVAVVIAVVSAGCRQNDAQPSGEYLYVWAGDSAGVSSDFLGVIDASEGVARAVRLMASGGLGAEI